MTEATAKFIKAMLAGSEKEPYKVDPYYPVEVFGIATGENTTALYFNIPAHKALLEVIAGVGCLPEFDIGDWSDVDFCEIANLTVVESGHGQCLIY